MDFFLLFLALIAVINLALALFVFSRNPLSWVNRSFVLFVGTLSLWTVCIGMLFTYKTLLWSDLTLFFGNLLGVSSFLLFARHFPDGQKLIRKYLIFFYLIPIGIFLLLSPFHPFVSGIVVEENQIQPVLGPLYPVLMLWSIFGALFGSYIIFKKYRKSSGRAKYQLKYLLFGFFSFLFLVTLTGVILPAFQISRFGFFSPAASLIMVGFISYAIIKHRLMDIRFVVARSVAYLVLLFLIITALIAWLFITSNLFFKTAINLEQTVVFISIMVIIAFLIEPLKNFLEKITDAIFFKGKYNSNKFILELTTIMALTNRLDELTKKTLNQLLTTMRISKGAFIIFRKNEGYDAIHEGYEEEQRYDLQKLMLICELKRLIIFEEEQEGQIKEIMREMNIAVALPLFEDGHKEGLLVLGEKKSGEIYSQQDIEVLNIFGPEMLVAIQNAKSYEEISRFNITLREEVDKATKELRDANARLMQLDKLKDEFVSVASHELRTPLTAIKSYLWMALDGRGGEISEKQKFYLQRAYNSVDRLIRLVSDMLNVSRIDSGRISLQLGAADIQKIVQDVFDEVMPRIQELGIYLTMAQTPSLPQVLADSDKVKEVLFNLIGNAMKFTSKGGTITISFAQKENMIETTVTDTGTGIDPANIDKLFQKFSMIADSYMANSSIQGTGLGLYISKSIVELHGGKIWATSEGHGKGTKFTFSLKIVTEEDKRKLAEQPVDVQKSMIDIIHTGV